MGSHASGHGTAGFLLSALLLLLPASGAVATEDPAWPTEHVEVEVRLDPERATLDATGRLRLTAPADPDRPLHFLLHRDLEPGAVRLDGRSLETSSRERWRPRDFWRRPDYAELAAYGRTRQHTVRPPEGGWPAEGFELELSWSGAVYDSLRPPDVAYARGFETTSGLIDPRGAFLTGETFWVPWTAPERFTFRLRTILPGTWHSMSQGGRVEHLREEGHNVTVWDAPHPHEQIYLVAGPYTIREREHRGVALYTYTYADTPEDLAVTYLDGAGRYLDLYGERIGPYPFAKWAMVENWWQTGFGMPGFTLLGDRVIRLPFIVDTSYGHEILHCWWGNGVYVDYATGNWCEGLTAYGADYFYKEQESPAAARDYRRNALAGYLDFASGGDRDFALREFRERSDFGTQAIGYGKSMMVFHMLERRLGESVFRRGLQDFYRAHRFESAGWDDLATTFSAVADEDLRPWFEQWVDRTGAARLQLGRTTRTDDGWRVELLQEGEPYDLRVHLRYRTADGSRELQHRTASATSTLELPPEATSVAVDPDYHLFRRLYREEIPPTLSQALGADSTLVVIGAETPPPVAEALEAVAQEWARNQDMKMVREGRLSPEMAEGRSVFLMGPGPWARRALEASAPFGTEPRERHEEATRQGDSFVYCVRDPADPERAWVVLLPEDPEAAAALGRKIPHYSKYSWLRFRGDENVGKGAWSVVDSPLRRELREETGR